MGATPAAKRKDRPAKKAGGAPAALANEDESIKADVAREMRELGLAAAGAGDHGFSDFAPPPKQQQQKGGQPQQGGRQPEGAGRKAKDGGEAPPAGEQPGREWNAGAGPRPGARLRACMRGPPCARPRPPTALHLIQLLWMPHLWMLG